MKSFVLATACITAVLPAAATAMPNPASVFCGKMGGHSVIAKLPDGGDVGLCYLPNKKIVEQWTLFRMLDGKRLTARNNPFR